MKKIVRNFIILISMMLSSKLLYSNPDPKHYEVLGVGRTATSEEIKRAYREKALQYHPDKHSGKTEKEKKAAEEKFKAVASAYGVLSDPAKKQLYDRGCNEQGIPFDTPRGTRDTFSRAPDRNAQFGSTYPRGGYTDFPSGFREDDLLREILRQMFADSTAGTSSRRPFGFDDPLFDDPFNSTQSHFAGSHTSWGSARRNTGQSYCEPETERKRREAAAAEHSRAAEQARRGQRRPDAENSTGSDADMPRTGFGGLPSDHSSSNQGFIRAVIFAISAATAATGCVKSLAAIFRKQFLKKTRSGKSVLITSPQEIQSARRKALIIGLALTVAGLTGVIFSMKALVDLHNESK